MSRTGMIKLGSMVNVSVFSAFTFFLFVLSQGILYSLIFLFAIFIHELSHIVLLGHYGAKIEKIDIYPFGVDIYADTHLLSYKKELAVTLAGSVSNLICGIAGSICLCFFASAPLLFFVLCHFSLGFFNLIPVSTFDGGRALRLILYDFIEIDTAYYIQLFIDFLSSFLILFLCVMAFTYSCFNISVLMLSCYAILTVTCLFCAKKSGHMSAL